jgi:hypothetical protein
LNYYGSFVNGCGGSLWRPYFTSASWDPYGSGAWAYYPSAGYSWVSPYPWGWTPYHYGSWAFCQGIGWGWMPGGLWMGLANYGFANPAYTTASAGSGGLQPHPPVHPPAARESSFVGVNLKSAPTSSLGANDTFVFRKDSAGLGVPRGSLGKLNGFSNQTAQHGMASTTVYYSGGRNEGGERGGNFSAQSQSYSPSSSSVQSASPGVGASHSSMQSGASSGGGARR